jgi:hypothetical protein
VEITMSAIDGKTYLLIRARMIINDIGGPIDRKIVEEIDSFFALNSPNQMVFDYFYASPKNEKGEHPQGKAWATIAAIALGNAARREAEDMSDYD